MDSVLDSNEALLQTALETVNRKIQLLQAQLESENGRLLTTKLNLDRAMKMRVEIASLYSTYNNAVETVLETYSQAAIDAVDSLGIDFQFSQADAELLKAMTNDSRVQLLQYGVANAAEVSNATYLAVVTGGSLDDLVMQTEQMLIGGTDKRGRPLSMYAKTIASTNYMSVNNVVNKRVGERLGVDKWKYTGTTVRDSRPFCVERAGKVYTTEEINAWNKLDWAGKAGDVWVNCGGWNCRHTIRPYIE
jgi:hypothetical protein